MGALTCINDYLKIYGAELGHRVVDQFPPLHQPSDPVWPAINQLRRNPFPAQTLAIMGIIKRWEEARCAAAVAKCAPVGRLSHWGNAGTSPSSAFARQHSLHLTQLELCSSSCDTRTPFESCHHFLCLSFGVHSRQAPPISFPFLFV